MPNRLKKTVDSTAAITIAAAASALPFPPEDSTAAVPDSWEVDELVSGTIAATDIDSVTNATNTINEAAHGLSTGDGPVQLTTTGTLPAGLSLLTDYWIIVTGAGTFKLAASLADALAGTAVSFSDDGTGTHTYTGNSPNLVSWYSLGLLGHNADGAITLTARQAYAVRVDHASERVLYSVKGTLSASTVDITLTPVYSS
jgi:hypothetical protein